MLESKGMIPKSGYRFSDQIMLESKGMIPKSGYRFSDQIMLESKGMIPKSGYQFSDQIIVEAGFDDVRCTSSGLQFESNRLGQNAMRFFGPY